MTHSIHTLHAALYMVAVRPIGYVAHFSAKFTQNRIFFSFTFSKNACICFCLFAFLGYACTCVGAIKAILRESGAKGTKRVAQIMIYATAKYSKSSTCSAGTTKRILVGLCRLVSPCSISSCNTNILIFA